MSWIVSAMPMIFARVPERRDKHGLSADQDVIAGTLVGPMLTATDRGTAPVRRVRI